MTEPMHVSSLDIDLDAAAAAFSSGGEKPAEKGNGTGALENVDLTTAAAGMDFPGALALISGLTFEAMHPELVLSPAPMPESETGAVLSPDGGAHEPADDDELPEWLRPAPREASLGEDILVGESPQVEIPSLYPETLSAADVLIQSEWPAEGPEDRGAGEDGAVSSEEEAEEEAEAESGVESERKISINGMKEAFISYLSTWLDRNRLAFAAELTGGTAAGFLTNLCFTELIAKNPQMASFLPRVLANLQSATILATNTMETGSLGVLAARGKGELLEKHIRGSSLAERIAVSHTVGNIIDKFFFIGLSVSKIMRDVVIRPGTTGFTAGAWLYAALAGAGVFGEDHQLINGADAVAPVASGGGGEGLVDHPKPVDGSIGQVGGLSPEDRGVGAIVQPPADVATANEATQAAQAAAQQAEAAAQVAAQAAEAARIAALQQGPTVAELAAQMPKQTVSEAIYQMIGDVPHRGEVTNVLFRAIGDKVNSLNEGAIRAAAEALRPVFENIDKVMANSGTVYTEGGRAVIEAMSGFNSPEAQAIRAANMGDLEAAGNLLNNVIDPVIR